MSTKTGKSDPKFALAYDRGMLRSAFVSLFWSVIAERKRSGNFTLQGLAKTLGKNKAEVSRWFGGDPNWTLNTIASIANALDVELQIVARDKAGKVYMPTGITTLIDSQITKPATPLITSIGAPPFKSRVIGNSPEIRPPRAA